MAGHSPFQMELTSDELDLIERWSSMAGCRTKQELLLNAFTLFEWAAKQVMLGRRICAMNEATGEIRHAELPALAQIADWGAPPILTQEEIRRRMAEPGFPFSESDFGFGAKGNVEADCSLDAGSKNGSSAHVRKEPAVSGGTAGDPAPN
jgi:hypothetical protein